jgi:hypothetical protein
MTDEQINWAITEAIGADPHWKCAKDYCTDLNAMHDAEKLIYNHNNMWTAYYYAIGAGPFSLHATARKKAEAFLKALGKWEEVQG